MANLFAMLDPLHIPAAATAGILSHRAYFIYGEHHANGPMLLRFYTMLVFILFVGQITIGRSSTTAAFRKTAELVTVYATSLFASMVVYRCLFHPLRTFPGPLGARVSKLWHAYHIQDSKSHLLLDKLHQDYGDFVRTGECYVTLDAQLLA